MWKWALLAALSPGILCAQMMPMGEVCRQGRPAARDLNLTEAQQKNITTVCVESFKKVSELRESWKKAEAELQAAFDESPVDQTKSNNAIERLAAARSDLFRATSQMDLKIRTVLTDEQWQQLKQRDHRGPGGPGGGPGRPGGPGGRDGGWRRTNKSTTSPPISQQPNK
jgi:Spy/CpxP family protein refolding chaperone